MGQLVNPSEPSGVLLSPVDRLVSRNAAGGLSPNAEHIIALGEDAARNLPAADHVIALGEDAGANMGAVSQVIAIGQNAALGNQNSGQIVIGNDNLGAGFNSGTAYEQVIIGARIANLMTNTSAQAGGAIMIGHNILPLAPRAENNIIIGRDVLQAMNIAHASERMRDSVIIGRDILHTLSREQSAPRECVIIGAQAARTNASSWGVNESVIIGYRAMDGFGDSTTGGIGSSTELVVIGALAGRWTNSNQNPSSCSGTIFIGPNARLDNSQSGASANLSVCIGPNAAIGSDSSVCIGSGTVVRGPSGTTSNIAICTGGTLLSGGSRNIVMGMVAQMGGSENILFGHTNNTGPNYLASRCIIIGHRANTIGTTVGNRSDMFLVETTSGATGGTKRTYLYGLGGVGLIVGNSTEGTNRDFATSGVTNALKLINGTRGLGNPAGGGFFYVDAGVLHWVGSDGRDDVLSPAAGLLAESQGTAYTDGAAANLATLTNAPAAGDPTKWIPINDNGTTRYIPAW